MDIKITEIKGQRLLTMERVCFEVLRDCDIGDYILMDTTYDDSGSVSNKNRHVYIFPSKKVKKGHTFEVYTRSQHDKTKVIGRLDASSDNFFMGLGSPIWNKDKDTALLVKVEDREEFEYQF